VSAALSGGPVPGACRGFAADPLIQIKARARGSGEHHRTRRPAMNELDNMVDHAEDEPVSDAASWIGRVADASSDYETIGSEVAADIGL
jgi:hypothetical protein